MKKELSAYACMCRIAIHRGGENCGKQVVRKHKMSVGRAICRLVNVVMSMRGARPSDPVFGVNSVTRIVLLRPRVYAERSPTTAFSLIIRGI